jgi:hypothetical protein
MIKSKNSLIDWFPSVHSPFKKEWEELLKRKESVEIKLKLLDEFGVTEFDNETQLPHPKQIDATTETKGSRAIKKRDSFKKRDVLIGTSSLPPIQTPLDFMSDIQRLRQEYQSQGGNNSFVLDQINQLELEAFKLKQMNQPNQPNLVYFLLILESAT